MVETEEWRLAAQPEAYEVHGDVGIIVVAVREQCSGLVELHVERCDLTAASQHSAKTRLVQFLLGKGVKFPSPECLDPGHPSYVNQNEVFLRLDER